MADELRAQGVRLKPSLTEKINLHPRPVRRRPPRKGLRPGRPEGVGRLPGDVRGVAPPGIWDLEVRLDYALE